MTRSLSSVSSPAPATAAAGSRIPKAKVSPGSASNGTNETSSSSSALTARNNMQNLMIKRRPSNKKKDDSLEEISPWLVADPTAHKKKSEGGKGSKIPQLRTVITTEL